MIPNSNEKKWRDLLINNESPALKSLSLKLKLASLKASKCKNRKNDLR